MFPLHDVRRRPVRSALTAAGMAIGVAALVLLGGLAEKLGRLVEGGRDFATGQVTVSGSGTGAVTGMTRGGLLSREQLAALGAVPGVALVAPLVMFPLSDAPATLPFTLAPLVFGADLVALERNRQSRPPRVRSGRLLPTPGGDDHVSVVSPADAARELDRSLVFLNSVIVGSALVALVVASLAVTNTMFTGVVERRREIGLRRVVGATRRQVVGWLVAEAASLGIAGSLLGLLAGTLAVAGLNAVAERLGAPVFLVTPRLALLAGVLPAALAALAGLWPAWRAARLPPTEAIRYA